MYANFQKEEISRAYVAVVAAAAGCSVMEKRIDDDGFDLQLHRSAGRSPQIGISLKATAEDHRTESHLRYSLRKSDHKHLRRPTLVPRALVVLVVDEDLAMTVAHTEDALAVTKGAYWLSLLGADESPNTASVTVELPRSQQFSQDALAAMMDAVEMSGQLL